MWRLCSHTHLTYAVARIGASIATDRDDMILTTSFRNNSESLNFWVSRVTLQRQHSNTQGPGFFVKVAICIFNKRLKALPHLPRSCSSMSGPFAILLDSPLSAAVNTASDRANCFCPTRSFFVNAVQELISLKTNLPNLPKWT